MVRRSLTPIRRLAQLAPLSTDTTAVRRQRQIYFGDVDCAVSEEEGCKAQRELTRVLLRRCTIEHTADVLPADRLFSVLSGKEPLREVLRALGLYQFIQMPDDDRPRVQSTATISLNSVGFNDTIAGTRGQALAAERKKRDRLNQQNFYLTNTPEAGNL